MSRVDLTCKNVSPERERDDNGELYEDGYGQGEGWRVKEPVYYNEEGSWALREGRR